VNPKKFMIELKRRNISESRDRKRARDADQHLTQDYNLHIVNEQSDPLRIAYFFQRLRYAQSVCAFHISA